MLRAYMDDSGTHASSPVCVLAGYFGGERHWLRFESDWRRILRSAKVEEFHSKRFWGRTPAGERLDEYRGWTENAADTFLEELLSVITNHGIFPLACAVVMKEWLSLHELERRYLTGARVKNGKVCTSGAPNKPYFLPFIRNVGKAASYCADHLRIDFAFDRNEPYCGYALDYFNTLGQMELPYWKRIRDISFPTSLETPGLQAADLLAYQMNHYAQHRLRSELQVRLPVSSILATAVSRAKDPKQDFKLFDRRGLDLVLQKFRVAFGERLSQYAKAEGPA